MIRVLHIVSALNSGGVENMLYNYYTNLERSTVHFDFVVHGTNVGILESRMIELGSQIFHVIPKKKSLIKNIFEINRIIVNGNYNIVHCHQGFSNFTSLFIAWVHNVPIRVSHSHLYKSSSGIFINLIYGLFRFLNKLFANYFFACSTEAGKCVHGKKWNPSDRNILMRNAIDLKQFTFNSEIREEYRKMLCLNRKKVLLHVGRFSEEKNHTFLIDIFTRINEVSDDYILLLVGNGDVESKISDYVSIKNLGK
jgi:glycosyltransferase involved in cell wall biosynthesis